MAFFHIFTHLTHLSSSVNLPDRKVPNSYRDPHIDAEMSHFFLPNTAPGMKSFHRICYHLLDNGISLP